MVGIDLVKRTFIETAEKTNCDLGLKIDCTIHLQPEVQDQPQISNIAEVVKITGERPIADNPTADFDERQKTDTDIFMETRLQ